VSTIDVPGTPLLVTVPSLGKPPSNVECHVARRRVLVPLTFNERLAMLYGAPGGSVEESVAECVSAMKLG